MAAAAVAAQAFTVKGQVVAAALLAAGLLAAQAVVVALAETLAVMDPVLIFAVIFMLTVA
jgi:hypothetical protein